MNNNSKIIYKAMAVVIAVAFLGIGNVAKAENGTTTVTTVDKGKVTTTTTSGSAKDANVVYSGTGGGSQSVGGGKSVGNSSKSSSSSTASDKKKDTKIYTGFYNNRQIIPNSMAMFCKVNGEDIVANRELYEKCINDITARINAKDAMEKQEAVSEYDKIRFEELTILLSQSIAKGASIANFEEVQNSLGEATAKTKTEHEDNMAIANSTGILTDVLNTMVDLYAERLRYEAINGIENISPSVIKEVAEMQKENSEKAKDASNTNYSSNLSGFAAFVEYTEDNPYVSEWSYYQGNSCKRSICKGKGSSAGDLNCKEEIDTCPDGDYGSVFCKDGNCVGYEENGKSDPCKAENLKEIPFTNQCSIHGGKDACPDGMYVNEDGLRVGCLDGECSQCLNEEDLQDKVETKPESKTPSEDTKANSTNNNAKKSKWSLH